MQNSFSLLHIPSFHNTNKKVTTSCKTRERERERERERNDGRNLERRETSTLRLAERVSCTRSLMLGILSSLGFAMIDQRRSCMV